MLQLLKHKTRGTQANEAVRPKLRTASLTSNAVTGVHCCSVELYGSRGYEAHVSWLDIVYSRCLFDAIEGCLIELHQPARSLDES